MAEADVDVYYWKARCRRAEGLLAKARRGLIQTDARTRVLSVLGELREGEWMRSTDLHQKANVRCEHLRHLERLGMVVSRCEPGCMKEWQLEHLVVPAATADDEAGAGA